MSDVDFHRDVTRFFHRELTHLEIMRRWSWLGQDIAGFLLFAGVGFGAGLEAEAVVAGFQDVAAVGEPIKQRCRHLCVAEDRGPFAEAEIGGDHDAGALIELAQKMEEQRAARGAERQVSQLVQDHEVQAHEGLGNLSCFALRLFLLERVDELDGREEPDLSAVMLDGLHAERGRDMGLSGARTTDQNDVLRPVHELAAMELAHRGLVHLAVREVEAGQILIGREARRLHMIGDRPDFSFCRLGFQQLGQDWHGCFKCWCALFDQIGYRLCHAMHLENAKHDDDSAASGIMTHGDLQPHSDIDLLAVVQSELTESQRSGLLLDLLRLSGRHPAVPGGARCLEVMVFCQAELNRSDYPARAEFVYGEWLREAFEAGETPVPERDPEYSLVIAQAHQEAIPLFGPPRSELLTDVSTEHVNQAMRDALPDLLAGFRGDERNVLLTLARMWHTASTGRFITKDAAAEWAMPRLSGPDAIALDHARRAYLGEVTDNWSGQDDAVQELVGRMSKNVADSM